MADDGFDPCECTWSHEMAMRRLLSILRQTQTYCTDTECFDEMPIVPRGQTLSDGSGSHFIFVAVCWLVLAFAMVFLRPRTRHEQLDFKTQDNVQDPQGGGRGPPAPPAPPMY
ncbi:small integral membrane protein 14 [Hetaerina americana]|uniref:small integral membrane protein 14 n=1 Tax=Hetaerina americana TaxID=62018 RepID=UPI003A7F3833